MQFVQCEACLKRIPREKAETFEDKDFFEHYACPEHLLEAMERHADKEKAKEMYAEVLES